MSAKRRLTRAQVKRIKRLYWTRRVYQKDLAAEYGVSIGWINAIVHDKAYVD